MSINTGEHALNEKYLALVIGVLAAAILTLRVVLSYEEHGGLVNALAHLSQFFTILTNTAVMILMFVIAYGRNISQLFKLSIVVAITGVGIIYHLLLAHLWSPEGLVWLADQGVHTLVPIVTIVWWLLFSIKIKFSYKQSIFMIIWPIIYTVYALIRAEFSGVYPYPFLDLATLGFKGLMSNVLGIIIAFLTLGILFITMNNFLLNRRNSEL